MKTDYFLTQNGKVYYFGKDGKEYKDQFYSNWGNMYYFGSDVRVTPTSTTQTGVILTTLVKVVFVIPIASSPMMVRCITTTRMGFV